MNEYVFELYLGPMFEGKTTKLIEKAKQRLICDEKILFINHASDEQRSNTKGKTITHDNREIDSINVTTLKEIDELLTDNMYYNEIDSIFINEIQFFEDASKYCLKWFSNYELNIYCAGLSGDIKLKPWKTVSELIPMVTHFEHLKSICKHTKKLASYTMLNDVYEQPKRSKSLDISSTKSTENVIDVGGTNKYQAVHS